MIEACDLVTCLCLSAAIIIITTVLVAVKVNLCCLKYLSLDFNFVVLSLYYIIFNVIIVPLLISVLQQATYGLSLYCCRAVLLWHDFILNFGKQN